MLGPGYDGGQTGARLHGRRSAEEVGYHMDRDLSPAPPFHPRQNGGGYGGFTRAPASPARSLDGDARRSEERNRSRPRNGRTASGQLRICKKCGEPLTGQFVRALDGTFHLDCFKCRDCGQIVASKFFPVDDENGEGQYPLCETDYFRRLGLLCHQCGGALRGSYITALERKYHVDHFTCSLCDTVFGAQDSYYEHDGQVYCHYHYSTQFAQRCNGCQTAILKQFVEIFRNGQNQHWHPECYMIHKFWNVRLTSPREATPKQSHEQDDAASRELVREEEERIEEKVYRIWSVLSTFEESSAACISDMLLHVSNGAYVDGVLVAKRFIWHVDILFQSADRLDATMVRLEMKGLSYGREAKLLCKKIVAFFSLLSKAQDKGSRKLGVTQELLSLVTGLAHYLKLLIRICLQGALRIEKERNTSDGLYQFLDDLSVDLETLKNEDGTLQITTGMARLSANDSDQCTLCYKPIEDECAKNGDRRWHLGCLACSRCGRELGKNLQDARLNLYDQKVFCNNCETYSSEKAPPFERVSKLQQYVFLLKVALARLLEILRSTGALPSQSEEQGADGQDAAEAQQTSGDREVPLLRSDTRSKSYAGERAEHRRESSYENTLNDVRRLRSTRLDKHLSTSFRKARASRLIDTPEGVEGGPANKHGQILEDEGDNGEGGSDMMLGHQDALTLDDIPRIVAAEQAAQQRPAYRPGRQELFRSPATEPNFGPGHQRSQSASRAVDQGLGEPSAQRGGRKYFSELSGLEYFIARHLAVLTMQPMVEGEFSLEELLSFIESRKPATFWNKFGKAFKNDTKKSGKKKGIFGVPLEIIIERDGADSTDGVGPGTLRIPAIVDDIISTMRKMDLSVEGVFRKNGNIKKLSELVERIDREGCDNVNLSAQPVVQVAALLKRYLRELPDPLMTHKLYRLWLAAAKIQDEDKRRQCLHLTCCLLPKCHRDCLEILFCFLKWAGSFHQVDDESGSKMDIKNLATVIAPNILYVNTKAPTLDSNPMFAIVAVETLITHIEEMCLVPDDLVDVLHDQSLFSNNGEITTKEILKRFGDRRVNGAQASYADVGEYVGRYDAAGRPLARRVETDPSVWQDERSVRPIQEPMPPYIHSAQSTPPPKWRNPDDPQASASPYNQSFEAADTGSGSTDPNQRREWRNSGWNRPNGSVGVTGSL
ncbi:Rho-type GTPase-activating protein 1 [Pleurostoma richardsiae]|uniref:Rho-type GTPase-activating protein 1 n=1 Tax=Pleurostoma richardsiae TaxID=41990 RepID=A0AA38RAA0_9PEZI|nr:Rho-type GTPase-activating protein 1 [Pleurostoma richardsiae]